MKPPICAICQKRFFEGGRLIYFKETEEDKEFNKRFKLQGFVGHPSNAFWFCDVHFEEALEYKDLTKAEAFKQLKKNKEI